MTASGAKTLRTMASSRRSIPRAYSCGSRQIAARSARVSTVSAAMGPRTVVMSIIVSLPRSSGNPFDTHSTKQPRDRRVPTSLTARRARRMVSG